MIFVGLEVDEVAAGLVDGLDEVVLLHVHVEGVEHDADARQADHGGEFGGLAGGITEIGLEAVERLDRQDHAVLGGVGAGFLQAFHHADDAGEAVVFADRGRGAAGEHQGRAVKRAADHGGAAGDGDIDAEFQIVDAGAVAGGVVRCQVAGEVDAGGEHDIEPGGTGGFAGGDRV